MSETVDAGRKCQRCGAPMGADVPEGLCPRCLMALNLATQTDAPADEVGPGGTKVAPRKLEPPPLPQEIAPHFPQLEIMECLGRGGMGVVYKARQPRLGRFVALKILAREKEKEARFAERFTREAQALARLNHPNIVTVYDFGEADGLFYLMMEFVDGMSLRQMLQRRKLAPEEALEIVPPICDALQYAHQQGIVHRDIKPENILLDKQGRVKIADFGIAKLLSADGVVEALTSEQQVVGTPHYMAPEQVEKPAVVDHRADIFSLGVVFYEMLTGELPLGKFAPPSRWVNVDVRLDEVVLHALEKEPERRYQQASQVKTDVETIARTGPGSTKPQPVGEVPLAAEDNRLASAWQQVKGPGNGLVVTAVVNWVAIPLVLLVGILTIRATGVNVAALGLPLAALVLSAIIFVAGLMMKRLAAYGLAVAGAILAMLVPPGNLIGLPIGIWALVVLSRREVRESFGQGHPMPGAPSRGGGDWKVAVIVVGAVMLLLAIPIAALIAAIAIPNFQRVRAQPRLIQQVPGVPRVLIRGTVTDALSGEPIAGARVDDNAYGARANRPPQQAWTDSQGHYTLRTWAEEHTLSASAPAYQTKLFTLNPHDARLQPTIPFQIDFQLQPAEDGATNLSSADLQVLEQTVRRGRQAWQDGDFTKAFTLLLPAALKGHAAAQHRVGVMYFLGQGVEQDIAEATRWFRKGAEQGQGESQYSMGLRYQMGQSVAQDHQEASRWFKLAADQGIGAAAAALARQYDSGEGVSSDPVESYKWATIAAGLSDPNEGEAIRQNLEARLTPGQIVEGKRRAREFVPKRVGPADP